MTLKAVIAAAEKWGWDEIKIYNKPMPHLHQSTLEAGKKLMNKFPVNKDVVLLGLSLMDIKLGEAAKEGKDHVEVSVKAAEKFLEKHKISEEITKKVINCVAAHHSPDKWKCKEAEICANADCYKFLVVKNQIGFLMGLGKEGTDFEKALDFAEMKADEKWKILSLDICKRELEPEYKLIKQVIAAAKK